MSSAYLRPPSGLWRGGNRRAGRRWQSTIIVSCFVGCLGGCAGDEEGTSDQGSGGLPSGGAVATGASGGSGATGGQSSGGTGAGGSGGSGLPLAGEPCVGYTFLGSPENDGGADFEAFLVDMDGNVVHTWGLTGFPPKLLPGGGMVGCTGVHPGTYDCIEMREVDWDGGLSWSFAGWEVAGGVLGARHHHDFFRGTSQLNYYAPGADLNPTGSTFILGHSETTIPIREDLVDDDVIYEVTQEGQLGPFRWSGADHLEEFGFDDAALKDIGARNPGQILELLHGNSITPVGPNHWYDDGNELFHPDNIIYSARQANFVVILHRETGNVLWRMGPDFAGRPEERLGQIIGQHHPHLIPPGLPGAGNMLIVDNGGSAGYGGPDINTFRYERPYSRVIEFDPLTFEVIWSFGTEDGAEAFDTRFLGSAQRLPNGNTLIDEGVTGRVIEVTPDKRVVWTFQHMPPDPTGKLIWIYRAFRVPPEWLPAGVNEAAGDYPAWSSIFE